MLKIIQSTQLIQDQTHNFGLFELLCSYIENFSSDAFSEHEVIVPHSGMKCWLRDQITKKYTICSNINFTILLNPIIEKIYLQNNPGVQLFDFSYARFIIYDFFCTQNLNTPEFKSLKSYLYYENKLNHYNAYELACQLEAIFHEYIYLRTQEMLELKIKDEENVKIKPKIEKWQAKVWHYVQKFIGEYKTYLDIYEYFVSTQAISQVPPHIYIFCLGTIYPSQLTIFKKIANFVDIYWFNLAISNHYYGDLLSNRARLALEKKAFKSPNLTIEDLYLSDANLLVANLAQQSREFNELLLMNEVEISYVDDQYINKNIESNPNLTTLQLLQADIKNLTNRISSTFRLTKYNEYYADPVTEVIDSTLAKSESLSVKINVCHNRLREVQVAFNEICNLLNNDSSLKFDQVLITAPNFSEYEPYIKAIFENEYAYNTKGEKIYLPCFISKKYHSLSHRAVEIIKLIINIPANLPVDYFLEIISSSDIAQSLGLNLESLELIKVWVRENQVYFGYDKRDYALIGYTNYELTSFKNFLTNLILGACIPQAIFDEANLAPKYLSQDQSFHIPYDNLENNQFYICNTLIKLINLLVKVRGFFYDEVHDYKEFTLLKLIDLIKEIQLAILGQSEFALALDDFLGALSQNEEFLKVNSLKAHLTSQQPLLINLLIFNNIIDNYLKVNCSVSVLSGKINCVSMECVRYIPFQVIYVLGLNFDEFPRKFTPHRLSILAQQWNLADRNYNLEDKQTFLEIILASQGKLFLSYVGKDETTNKVIEASQVVSLVTEAIENSISNFNIQDITFYQALHPFYKNYLPNYSVFWHELGHYSKDNFYLSRWNFEKDSNIPIAKLIKASKLILNAKSFTNTLTYTNINLYNNLGVSNFKPSSLSANLSIEFANSKLASRLFNYFELYLDKLNPEELKNYLLATGILAPGILGVEQYHYYLELYQNYIKIRGNTLVKLTWESQDSQIKIIDKAYVEQDKLIILNDFATLSDKKLELKSIDSKIRTKCLVYLALGLNSKVETILKETLHISSIELRLTNTLGEVTKFNVELQGITAYELLSKILGLYMFSLTNPLMVHKQAIDAYLAINYTKNFDPKAKEKALLEAFNSSYKNLGLDKLKTDVIFAPYVQEPATTINKITQGIFWIAKLLDHLVFTPSV